VKPTYKVSNRERWILTFAPALLIAVVYVYGFAGNFPAELEIQQKRLRAASIPLPPSPPSKTLLDARAALEQIKKDIADHEAHSAQMETEIAALTKNSATLAEAHAPARLIARVEDIFNRHAMTPLVSEAIDADKAVDRQPTALLAALAPKSKPDSTSGRTGPHLWHYVFNDVPPHFAQALKEVTETVPEVVPLSLNYVYNPDNDGETRLLELWLLY